MTQDIAVRLAEFEGEDRARSWTQALITAAGLVLAVVIAAQPIHSASRAVAAIAAGMFHIRLFVIYHDHQHGAILRQSLTARLLMDFLGIYFLAPSSVWRSSHEFHHSNNAQLRGSPFGGFPILTWEEYSKQPLARRFQYRLSRSPGVLLFGYLTVFFFSMCLRPAIQNPRKHFDCIVSIAAHGTWLWWLAGQDDLSPLFCVILPFTIACAVGSYIFFAQHNAPGIVLHGDSAWSKLEAARSSSAFIRMPAFMRWITANCGYHHIHHADDKIPFYRLPEVMGEVPDLQDPVSTSLYPRDVLACLRLSYWDPEGRRLITAAEARRTKRA